jgi:mannose-6-phosphate isomerase-like protein (cupin superfamily)
MFTKNFSQCDRVIMRGKADPSIDVSIVEMFRPEDGFDLSYNVAQFSVPKGKRTDTYHLKSTTELWFVKVGEGVAVIDGKSVPMNEQAMVYIKPGQTRCFINKGDTTLVYYSIAKPPFSPTDVVTQDEYHVEFIPPSKP